MQTEVQIGKTLVIVHSEFNEYDACDLTVASLRIDTCDAGI